MIARVSGISIRLGSSSYKFTFLKLDIKLNIRILVDALKSQLELIWGDESQGFDNEALDCGY